MIHPFIPSLSRDPLYPREELPPIRALPGETVLRIPPLAGARCIAPQPVAIPKGEGAGHPGGGSPCSSARGPITVPAHLEHSRETGRATGAAAGTYLPVAAMEAVLAERMRQIHDFGHTPQSDAELPLKQLPRAAQRFLTEAIEDCHFQRGDWRKAARKHLVRAGAMILAALDRIEAEPPEEEIGL